MRIITILNVALFNALIFLFIAKPWVSMTNLLGASSSAAVLTYFILFLDGDV
jgi:hypothetical protein